MTLSHLLYLVIGYACGSFPFAYLYGKSKGVNIFTSGSGNPGATNTMNVLGKQAAVVVLLFDILKGMVPVFIVSFVMDDTNLALWTATGAVLGHAFSVYTGMRGGKALATAGGALGALFPLGVIILIASYILLLLLIRYIVIATTLVIFGAVGFFLYQDYPVESDIALLILVAGVLYRHLPNWERVFLRNEPRVGQDVAEVTLPRLPLSQQRAIAVGYWVVAAGVIAAVWLTHSG